MLSQPTYTDLFVACGVCRLSAVHPVQHRAVPSYLGTETGYSLIGPLASTVRSSKVHSFG